MRTTLPMLTLAALLIASPALARGQAGEVHLSTYAGLYSPQAPVVDELDGNVEVRKAEAMGFGGQLTIWLNSNVAIAASGFYAQTSLDANAFGAFGSIDTNVLLAGGRLVVGIGGDETRPSILNLSAGVVANTTSYSDFIEGATHSAGVVGAALNIPLGSNAGLRLGVDDYIYDRFFEVGAFETEPVRQHDVVIYGGLTFYSGN